MRQRNVKNKDEIIERCGRYIVSDPCELKGRWRQQYVRPGELFLEIGSGKGRFIVSMAQAFPDRNFIAVEGGLNVAVRILEKAEAAGVDNLLVAMQYVENVCDWFGDGEVDGIYLHFSDPWPKARHAKRRLTHRERLARYRRIASPAAKLYFKTDDAAFFDFSLEEFAAAGLTAQSGGDDPHGACTTEYEDRAVRAGLDIHRVQMELHPGR
ncbi:MAG TPA: tRNA (guanosine(46)-N7)-methyltransferase TrmB [Clostridiales bacterium]|nr:tRNA (guanosine(46)-N7)-methyltransferase TrmB [Clostridiales bacterium]